MGDNVTIAAEQADAMRQLRRQWGWVAVAWVAAWLVAYWLLRPNWPFANRWLLLSGLVLVYGLWWVLWRHLATNHPAGSNRLLPTLGPGNALTLLRGLCIALISGFLFGPWPPGRLAWAIVALYTLADVADYFDGYLARRSHHVTDLGTRLDMEFDGLGTLVVILLAVSFGQLPVWYLVIGLARYLFVLGIWARNRRGLPLRAMTPSVHRRLYAGAQMGFLSVVLWPILPAMMATIAGTVFAAATATSFLRDWLVVTGTIDPASPRYVRGQSAAYRFLAWWLPLLLRLVVLVSMASILHAAEPTLRPTAWQALLGSWGLPATAALASGLALIVVVGGALVAVGFAGRLAALALVLPLGFDMATRGLQWDNGLGLVAVCGILLLGTGKFSLAQPEDQFLVRRLGEG